MVGEITVDEWLVRLTRTGRSRQKLPQWVWETEMRVCVYGAGAIGGHWRCVSRAAGPRFRCSRAARTWPRSSMAD